MLRSNNTQENLNEKYDCNSQYEEKLDENFLEFTLEELGIPSAESLHKHC